MKLNILNFTPARFQRRLLSFLLEHTLKFLGFLFQFLPARVVHPNSVTHQKQIGVQPLPAIVQLTEQAEPEARPKPRLKPASKSQSFSRQVSSDGNDQKKPKASRNQATPFIR
jgi:hypothetical protein